MTQLTLKWARKGIYPFDSEARCHGRAIASIPSMLGGVRLNYSLSSSKLKSNVRSLRKAWAPLTIKNRIVARRKERVRANQRLR